MNCQILFSRDNKKNITNLSSAELVKRLVKDNQGGVDPYITCCTS